MIGDTLLHVGFEIIVLHWYRWWARQSLLLLLFWETDVRLSCTTILIGWCQKFRKLNLSNKNIRVAFLQCDGNVLCENTLAQSAVWKNIKHKKIKKKHLRPLKRYKNCYDTCYTLELNSLRWQIWSETRTVTCDLGLWCAVWPSGAAIALKNVLFRTFTPHNT